MGKGEELGQQLRAWNEAGLLDLEHPTALANRLIDGLGAEEWLKGPIRDLASQPLLRQVLRQRDGGTRHSALQSLVHQLESTYAPKVLVELLALLQAATGQSISLSALAESIPDRALITGPSSDGPCLVNASGPAPAAVEIAAGAAGLAHQLHLLGPGVALAATAALVWRWSAGELQRWVFEPWGWSGGVVLVVLLALLQALALGPLKVVRRQWPLEQADATDPHQAWRWICAPWIHHANGEALLNLVLLLILLGPSPLPLPEVVLRYCLTSLATAALALLLAQRRTSEGRWDGASGAVSALIGLGSGASLLHWRSLSYPFGPLAIPAWVLLVVYGTLQLSWLLPRRSPQDSSRPIDRLLSSQWWWGLQLGLAWALISRLGQWLQVLQQTRPAG
ncbi:rhomboid family intramembrane serine protease [Synechococcus sp. CCY9201]|jgi:hypothetical protein|uniref:rhomboid family intramembrane serine protease n=1 Tax=unclassified Synechococcus TaxID=2626047 RepID=UPI0018CEEC55|nr:MULTISPECIES: rhomboid family intramembrane serine protease [unclassified Synechococcus]MEA5421589.1 rhomboid family intramembrane serine protease [Synechococcus sp. CCY9202]MEA5475459.1 rhomboid family intramembrane serine protease [Synechococcus sp. CCY9201]QPN60093.1 rhomboid family intramembrane serine protease [Synechococcus sp. CBW1002]QPN66884.1 rhomboid family intramembrane serine protease [Synechococcus sp. CBW1006]CAK6691383.1 hypothetical protein IFHNHDMJ_01007 [Synechococcus sp.